MPRFPRSVYKRGSDPDPRFSLANERTFLSWIRTSLALLAGGVALAALPLGLPRGILIACVSILLGLGIGLPIYGWFSWHSNEIALRESKPLTPPTSALILVVGLVLVGILLITGLLQ